MRSTHTETSKEKFEFGVQLNAGEIKIKEREADNMPNSTASQQLSC